MFASRVDEFSISNFRFHSPTGRNAYTNRQRFAHRSDRFEKIIIALHSLKGGEPKDKERKKQIESKQVLYCLKKLCLCDASYSISLALTFEFKCL